MPDTSNAKPRRAGALQTLTLSLASLVLFLVGAEIVTRWADLRPRVLPAEANPPWLDERWLIGRSDHREGLADAGLLARAYDLYRWDRHAVYGLRPNRTLSLIDPLAPAPLRERTRYQVQTNARGFRTPAFETRPTPGRARVVTLGDSSTFGWGVEQDEAYPAVLRQALARRLAREPASIEVINLGVPGYSSFQGRVLLEREGLPLAPDLVTWSFLGNDGQVTGVPDRVIHARRSEPLGAVLAILHRSRAYETLSAWIGLARTRAGAAQPLALAHPVRNVANGAESLQNVRDAVGAARDAGVPLVLVALCVRPPAARGIGHVASEEGAGFLNGVELLQAATPRAMTDPSFAAERARLEGRYGSALLARRPELWVMLPDGCHPSPIGHRILGEALAEPVAEMVVSRATPGSQRQAAGSP